MDLIVIKNINLLKIKSENEEKLKLKKRCLKLSLNNLY